MFLIYALHFLLLASMAVGKSQRCPCSDRKYCAPVSKIHRKELVAFYNNDDTGWKSFNWTFLTTIVLTSSPVNISDLICYAHSRNVRVTILTSINQMDIPKLTDSGFRQGTVKSWLDKVKELNLDGVNIDIESSVYADDLKLALVDLAKDTTSIFKAANPQYQITWDVPYSPQMLDCVTGWCYDFKAISEATDFLIVMSYDAQLNILAASANSPLPLIELGYIEYINNSLVSPDKLVMAVPWYGYDYTCRKLLNKTGDSICIIHANENKQRAFSDIIYMKKSSIEDRWDDSSKSPFFTITINDTFQQYWYDDIESLTYKYKFAVSKQLHGIGMFGAYGLDYKTTDQSMKNLNREMWSTITYYVSLL